MRRHVLAVLEQHEFASRRAKSMDIDDFLRLLMVFNDAGVYFA